MLPASDGQRRPATASDGQRRPAAATEVQVVHGGRVRSAARVVAAGVVILALNSCTWLPADPGPPVIENAPLPPSAEWSDTCVVGTWRLTSGQTTVDLGDREVELSTTGERVFTATSDGRLSIEFPGEGLRWHGSNGTDTIDGAVTGSATGTFEAVMGRWTSVVDNSGAFTSVILNGAPDPPRAGGSADTGTQTFFCTEDELVLVGENNRMTYARQ